MKHCFFDVCIDGIPRGRISMDLNDEIYPKTAENFYRLCVGDKQNSKGEQLHLKGSGFHNIRVNDGVIVGGDFDRGNGTGGQSIYGDTFPKEDRKNGFEKEGTVGMVSVGEGLNLNSSIFFIAAGGDPNAFSTHVAFGRVVDGMELVKKISAMGDSAGMPTKSIVITECGSKPK